MAYIGRDVDKISNVEVLDNITFDGSSSYTLQKNSVNFTPSSANTLLVSIDGVVQAGNFTVSGSTIDFGVAIAGTSTCDFILHYGVGLITTPADGTVTTAKIGDSAVTTAKLNDASVSLAKLTATGTKDATTFLRGDNTFAEPGGGGKILQVVEGSLTTSFTSTSTTFVATGLNVSITPSATSSKVFVQVAAYADDNNNSIQSYFTIYRDSTNLGTANGIVCTYGAGIRLRSNVSMSALDSPSTTSAINYEVYMKNGNGVNLQLNSEGSKVRIIAMEVGA